VKSRTVLIRTATDEEVRTERWGIGGTDQAAVVLVDGEVVCWTDDYGTARQVPGGRELEREAKKLIEAAVVAAFDVYTELKLK
jgi:hypothetical protein